MPTNWCSGYVILLFHGSNGYVNVPEYYVVRTLPVLIVSLNMAFPET